MIESDVELRKTWARETLQSCSLQSPVHVHAYILWWGLMRDSLVQTWASWCCRFYMVGGGKVGVGVANPRASYIYIYIVIIFTMYVH